MINLIKKSGKLLIGKKRKVAVLFFMMVISAVLETLGVTLIVPVVSMIMDPDFTGKNKFIGALYRYLPFRNQKEFAVACVIVLIFIFVFKNLFLICRYQYQFKFVCEERVEMQRKLLSGYLQKPYYYFMNINTAEILRMLGTDVNSIYQILITLLTLCSELIVSGVLVVLVFIISPMITAAVAAVLITSLIVIIKIVRPVLIAAGKNRKKYMTKTNKMLLHIFGGIKEIKITGTEEAFFNRYSKMCSLLALAERKNSFIETLPMMLLEMTGICSGLGVLAVFIYMEIDVKILIPQLAAFALAAVRLMPGMYRIANAVNSITYLEPSLDVVLNLLNENKNDSNNENEGTRTEEADRFKPDAIQKIKLEHVTFRYPKRNDFVFQNANISIPIGKSVGIVGTSGAGKTTIVDVLMGLLPFEKGTVLIDDKEVDFHACLWRKDVGYISQNLFMLDDSIRENIVFGRICHLQEERVWEVLEKAKLADFVRKLPSGLDTVIGEGGVRLSGGQRQRIAVARALFTDPGMIVMDEATSALDNETERAIMESIQELKAKKTLIIIAHRLSTIEQCDVLYRSCAGREADM